jgi:uncharacterized RDD family membrane protein YckC
MNKNPSLTKQAQKAFGRRIFAALIDLVLWFVLFIFAAINFGKVTTVTHEAGTSTNATLTGLPLLIFILIELSYFVILEWRFGGTLGKLLLGVRVVNAGGGRVTPKQALLRNLLRAVDAFPYFVPYITGLILVAGDGRKRRLGDKVANTVVVLK